MRLSYPENTIWLIESRNDDELQRNYGSAIAIRLQEIGKPQTAATYLLTCEHVLRKKAKDGSPGFGDLFPRVRAWAPDTAFSDKFARFVKIAVRIKKLALGNVPKEMRESSADDWVILEFLSAADRKNADAVKEWDVSEEGAYEIVGFPGSDLGFIGGIVKPTTSPERFTFRDETNGTQTFLGTQTRLGFSGGGVFHAQKKVLVGVHRARIDATTQVRAVSAKKIRDRLVELGYEPVAAIGIEKEIPSIERDSKKIARLCVGSEDRGKAVEEAAEDNPRPRPKFTHFIFFAFPVILLVLILFAISMKSRPPQLLSFSVTHFANDESDCIQRELFYGRQPRENDGIKIYAEFEDRAYCYLVALNPDGGVQLCFPQSDKPDAHSTTSITYPENDESAFGLTDGPGQQVFLLIASNAILPRFDQWEFRPEIPWSGNSNTGSWRYSYGKFQHEYFPEQQDRGDLLAVKSHQNLRRFFENLRADRDIEVYAVGFEVQSFSKKK